MLREQVRLFNRLSILPDFTLVVSAMLLAYHVRSLFQGSILPPYDYFWVLLVILPVWYYLLNRQGLYSSIRRLSVFNIATSLINVHLLGGLLTASVIYFLDRDRYSRGLFLAFLGISFLLLCLEKIAVRLVLGFCRRQGFNTRNLLIVGTEERARRFHDLVEDHADWGLKIIGFLCADICTSEFEIEGHPVLGNMDDLMDLCITKSVDEVVFCIPKDLVEGAEDFLQNLQELGITVRMILDFYVLPRCKMDIGFFHETLPVLTFHTHSLDAEQLFLKRLMDIAGALFGLSILAMLFPFIALATKLDSVGPIFFSQERVGQSGRIFRLWKFRSMYQDAEERKKELSAQNEMNGAIFKIKNDPRVTRVGRFLRKTSLDELPQFWNVLRGDMSLVGTRPPTPDEVARYENWHRRRISIKPGITGMWQTSGRSSIEDFDEIVRLDLYYIDKWNIWLDIWILMKTVRTVLAGSGSC